MLLQRQSGKIIHQNKKTGKGSKCRADTGARRSRAVGGNWLNCRPSAKETLSNEVPNRSSVSGAPAILANVQSDSSIVYRGNSGNPHHTSTSTIFPASLWTLYVPQMEKKVGRFKSWNHGERFSVGRPPKKKTTSPPSLVKMCVVQPL